MMNINDLYSLYSRMFKRLKAGDDPQNPTEPGVCIENKAATRQVIASIPTSWSLVTGSEHLVELTHQRGLKSISFLQSEVETELQ